MTRSSLAAPIVLEAPPVPWQPSQSHKTVKKSESVGPIIESNEEPTANKMSKGRAVGESSDNIEMAKRHNNQIDTGVVRSADTRTWGPNALR